ncbi:MAG: T9SS type A sorting domain-containing protein [Sphingobacteriia bacterium]|nr:T9SS type A sorting domain-containing protein [Sphingobacteriia bacterium]
MEVTGEESNSIPSFENTIHASIYPNPGNGLFNIRIAQQADYLEVFSLTGQLVYSRDIISEELTIDLRSLNSGLYLAKISNRNTGLFTTKNIIIQ